MKRAEKPIDPRAQVAEIRAERDALLAQRDLIDHAPLPAIDALTRAEAWRRDFAALPVVDVGTIRAATLNPAVRPHLFMLDRLAHQRTLDPLELATAIVCTLLPDVVTAAVREALAAAEHAVPGGLPRAERAAALAEIDEKVFRLECVEEAVIAAAFTQGTLIGRRHDVDPRAPLGEDFRTPEGRPKALATLQMLEELAHQKGVLARDLGDRRLQAYQRLQRAEADLNRATQEVRHSTVAVPIKGTPLVPPTFEAEVADARAAFERLDPEHKRAQAELRDAAACLPTLREALGVRGPEIRAA